jgi:hypothetical protein
MSDSQHMSQVALKAVSRRCNQRCLARQQLLVNYSVAQDETVCALSALIDSWCVKSEV